MTKKLSALVLLGLCAWTPAGAHHSFTAQFDAKKPITLKGTVTGMDWVNPHAWIHLDVTGADGTVEKWSVETGSPNILVRRGFTKKSLEVGTAIVVQGYMAKNGENKVNGGSVVFKDGTQLFLGGSNPDQPVQP